MATRAFQRQSWTGRETTSGTAVVPLTPTLSPEYRGGGSCFSAAPFDGHRGRLQCGDGSLRITAQRRCEIVYLARRRRLDLRDQEINPYVVKVCQRVGQRKFSALVFRAVAKPSV